MARTRRLPVTLIVCLVSSLLISNYADGETIKNSPTLLDKLRASSEYDASRTSSPALGRGLPLEETAASVRPLPEDPQSDELLVKEQTELESKEINSVKSTVSSLEKVSVVVNEVQETTSSPHVTGILTGERNTEDNVYSSNLEKSSSIQTILDESQKLNRTKDAASSLTTKPILEETSMQRNDSQEKTSQQEVKDYDTAVEATTAKLSSQEFAPKKMNANNERSLSLKLESTTESSANIEKKENLKEEKSEDIFPRKELHEDTRGENEVSELESKHSEVQDLEKVEKKEDGWSISLINDTNVNYKSGSSTDGDFRSNSESRGLENNTNSISGDDVMSHERVGPKEEVEVVKNVTQSPIQKMLDGSKQRLSTPEGNEPGFNPEASDKQQTPGVNTGTLQDGINKPEEITGKVEDGRLGVENGTSRNNEEEQTISSPEGNPNLVPRGRTIAFSGVNEFPSLETKTTTVTAKEIDLPSTKKNISTDKSLEQKPYPYLKSTREPVIESSLAINSHGGKSVEVENSTTEESPAFENTIVRGDTEKKIIVTEPSVVLENSIQQFKPADQSEKSENESSNNSTSSQISPSTTLIVPEVVSGNGTQDKKAPNESIVGSTEAESMSANGNDVPEGSEVSEVITSKDGSFDVTGNGITEVSPKPKTTDKEDSYKNPFVLVNGTTELPLTTSTEDSSKMGSNADVQTDAEESLLMRSTLNVTEVSTQLPFTLDISQSMKMAVTTVSINSNTPEPENTTIAPMILSNSTDQSPMTVKDMIAPSESPSLNATDEIPSKVGNATGISDEDQSKISDENLMITTTGVEYEFVGLTEATTILNGNTTEQIVKENSTELPTTGLPKMTIIPEVLEISTKEYNIEDAASTIVPESVTDNPPGTNAIESTMAYETTTLISTDEIPAGRTMPVFTTEFKMKDSTVPVIENQTEKGLIKDQEDVGLTGSTYSWSITTESQTMVTVIDTENPLDSHQAKDATTITEVANTKLGSTPIVETTTVARVHELDDSTSSPFVPNSLPPRVLPPSTSTESPIKDTTDLNQNLSPDEITSLVQIVVKGTSYEVCPELDALKAVLAKLLTIGAKESVSAEQIIIHQNPCLEPQPPMATPAETPLISILVYIVDSNGKFDSAKTNMLPSLYNTTNISFPVTIHSFLLVQEKDSGNAIAVVVVSSVAFICLVLLAGLLFIMRKRQTRFNYGERCRPVSLDAYSLDNVSAYNSVRRKGAVRSSKRSYGNPTFEDSSAIPSHPLNFASLSSFCNDTNAINEEFTGIPQVSAKMDELPTGAEVKNRYANVIPLPETRVPLQKINNDPLTEYINASYVRGPRNATRYYIACQGPMESTVTDFWRMIWEQQSKVIIMLTDLVENDVEKCSEYIPPSEVTDCHRLYGDFQVTLKKRETKEKYAISTLHLKNLENNTFREVYHIWYLWPVNGVQSDGAGLIAVILEARALQRAGPGPIVVHCSPGTGRTGTLIALDLGIRQYEITRTVDVPRVVYTIRRDRAGAVQTKEQYAFIYKALNLYATKLAGGGGLEST